MPVLFDSSNIQPVSDKPVITQKQVNDIVGSKETKRSFNSFIKHPRSIHFLSQGKDEHIILFLRKHPITQLPWILSSLILIGIPLFLIPLVKTAFPIAIPANYGVILYAFYYLIVFAYMLVNFILWYYNVNMVTSQRVVDIDFAYLLVQEMSATRITQIEDVTIQTIGVFSALFDYGNVIIQTAGADPNIEFLSVPKPEQVSQIIIRLMGEAQ
jgi:hypothetical protein